MTDKRLPERPKAGAKKQDWVSYVAAHGENYETARAMTLPELQAWKPKAQGAEAESLAAGREAAANLASALEDEAQAAHISEATDAETYPEQPEQTVVAGGNPYGTVWTFGDTRPSVDEAWSAVMAAVPTIPKSDYNEDQGFHFRGVDATVDAIGRAMRQHKVKVIPVRAKQIDAVEYTTKRGTRMVNRIVQVRWQVRGPRGDHFPGESLGESADSGDKAMPKAMSVAYRTFLLQAIAAATGERDPDADSHERATPSEREQATRQASGRSYANRAEYEAEMARQAQEAKRQAQAGEENQAAQSFPESSNVDPWTGQPDASVREPDSKPEDNSKARAEMWKAAKDLGWEWSKLAARFKSDYSVETSAATVAQLNEFKQTIIVEADEEAKAKALVQNELGGREVEGDGPRF